MKHASNIPNNSPFRERSPPINALRSLIRSWRRVRLSLLAHGKLAIAQNVVIGANADVRPPQRGTISEYVAIGKNFTAEVDFDIGPDVLISSNVSLIGNQHRFDDPSSTVYRQGRVDIDCIALEGDNLIGFGTTIVGTITIGKGAIVGAGSLVTRDLPGNWIYVGVPAKPIRQRYA